MLVYRVEHKVSGFGPFSLLELFTNRHQDEDDFPNLAADYLARNHLGMSFNEYMKCRTGVDTLDLIKHWFDEDDREILVKEGYILTVWDVHPDDVRYGRSKKQVLFRRDQAKLLQQKELTNVQ